MILLRLFLAFLQIGAFSFGGGYAAMPLIQSQVVTGNHWLSMSDFTDLVTISQMTPGPIAVNAATFVGERIAGLPGAVAATLGCILPSCLFVTLLAWLYMRYRKLSLLQGILQSLRPAVVAMIFSAGLLILIPTLFRDGRIHFPAGNLQLLPLFYFIAALFVLRRWRANPVLVMLACGGAELLVRLILRSI